MEALVAGGEERYVRGTFAKNLRTLGIVLSAFHGGKNKSKPVGGSLGCDIIIVLRDSTRPLVLNSAREMAEREGKLFVITSRKWTLARSDIVTVLKAHNISVIDLIRKLNSDPPPPVRDVLPLPMEGLPEKLKQNARTAIRMVVEEEPGMLLDLSAVAGKARGLLRIPEGIPTQVADTELMLLTRDEVGEIRGEWLHLIGPGRYKNDEVIDRRIKFRDMKRKWLVGWLKSFKDRGHPLPTKKEMVKISREIFGSQVSNETYYKVRRELGVLAPAPVKATQVLQEMIQQKKLLAKGLISTPTPKESVVETPTEESKYQTQPKPETYQAPPKATPKRILTVTYQALPVDPEEHERMTKLWRVCVELGVDPHPEALEYFGEEGPKDNLDLESFVIRACSDLPKVISIKDLPAGTTHIKIHTTP